MIYAQAHAMTITDEIKQTKFTNPYQKLGLNLLSSCSRLESFLKDILKRCDVTLQQYNILRILRGSRPAPLSTLQIRERMVDKMSDTSRIVDRLVLKQLVTKNVSRIDNRLVDIKITQKGLKLLRNLDNIDQQFILFFNNLNEEDATHLSDLLDKMHSPD